MTIIIITVGLYSLDEFLLPGKSKKADPSWFGFPLSIKKDSQIKRVELLKFYEERNIGTRLLFGGNLAIQPAYENTEFKIPDKLEVSEYILNNTFWLGVYPGITNEMLDFVFESTCEFLKDNQ